MAVKRAFATAGMSGVETAIVKATFDDDARPKSKHIKTICDYVEFELAGTGYDTYSSAKNLTLVEMFRKRVYSLNSAYISWKVVIKCLVTIHTLFRDCDISFCDEFAQNDNGQRRVLSVTKQFSDNASSTAIMHSAFIRRYSRYLAEKMVVFRALTYNVERKLGKANNKDFFKGLDVDKLGKILPVIMKQLHCVTEVEAKLDIDIRSASGLCMVHPLEREAMLLLIKDSLRVYSAIQLILWELLCNFQKLNIEQAQWVSKTYKSYFELNQRYQEWFGKVVRIGIVEQEYAPKFNTLPKSLATKLSKYIAEQEKAGRKKKKSRKKKSRKHESDSDTDKVDDLENVLTNDELDAFSETAQKYKSKKSKDSLKYKQNTSNTANGPAHLDLLGFGDLFNAPPSTSNGDEQKDDFMANLNISQPQFSFDDWGSFGDDKIVNQTQNNNTNGTSNGTTDIFGNSANNFVQTNGSNDIDDFWPAVPQTGKQGNVDLDIFSTNTVLGQQQVNGTISMSGGKPKVLKKSQDSQFNNNQDPFGDLLSLN